MNKIVLVGLLLIVGTAGCGKGAGNRQSLEGHVTLDGQPLPEGQITFVPQAGTKGPTAGSTIENGSYFIAADKGTFAGSFRVEITAVRKTGRKIKTSWGEMADETVSVLPARYNRSSELTAEVNSDAANQIDFALESE